MFTYVNNATKDLSPVNFTKAVTWRILADGNAFNMQFHCILY